MLTKTGDFEDGKSRSDFDMTKIAEELVLGKDHFYVGATEADKNAPANLTIKEKND